MLPIRVEEEATFPQCLLSTLTPSQAALWLNCPPTPLPCPTFCQRGRTFQSPSTRAYGETKNASILQLTGIHSIFPEVEREDEWPRTEPVGGLCGWDKNQMTQDIPLECVTSCLDLSLLSEAWRDSGPAVLRLHSYKLCLPSPPVLPGNLILQQRLRTHASCTGPRRIQVCIDRGLVSHIPRLPGRRPAPRRWLKNTPPRLEGLGCGQGTLCPFH